MSFLKHAMDTMLWVKTKVWKTTALKIKNVYLPTLMTAPDSIRPRTVWLKTSPRGEDKNLFLELWCDDFRIQ